MSFHYLREKQKQKEKKRNIDKRKEKYSSPSVL